MSTMMYSPLVWDRDGNPVEGGGNHVSKGICCTTCGRHWSSIQTELQEAQGKPREWKLHTNS